MNKIKMKLVETFSGVSMQKRGIEDSGLFDVETVATCETDINAIIGRAAIHDGLTNDLIDNYKDYPSREQMAKELIDMHIGYDFIKNKEYDWNKKAKSKSKDLEKCWLACKLSKNVGDISRVNMFPKCGMLTFSFPCTDLSVAGKQAGMEAGQTRSGLVWEVIRILNNMKDTVGLPNFLLMENVDALINKKNKLMYDKLNEEFSEIGYNVYYDIMNTKNTGIPQNRKRCYAMYIRKDVDRHNFTFPIPFDNGVRLKDILLDEVDEKYYITNEKAQQLIDKLIAEEKVS